jgi:dephospho-CoA kinase
MIILGLTGSIGMGKSTTASLLRELDVPVQDSDAVVAALYARGGAGVEAVRALYPEAVVDGAVDRERLAARVLGDAEALARLEAAVHPLVEQARRAFLRRAATDGALVAVLDVPLLFEVGVDRETDAVVVVSAPETLQRERVLARPGMTEEKLERILARQIPDAEKRRRADFVIDTGGGIEAARAQMVRVLAAVRSPAFRSRRDRGGA